jgi:tetratricopeptide (TPR) repeat protein
MAFVEAFRIRCLWAIAGIWLRLKRPERAANVYGRILRMRPNDPRIIFQRAWSLIEVPRRRNEAIEALRVLLEHSPSYPFGLFLLGSALQMDGRHQEAVHAFERADGESPGLPEFYFNWGKSLITLGRKEEAAKAFRQAALGNPTDVEAWRILGGILVELGRPEDGVACQERVMRLEPSAVHGLELGATLHDLNRLDEAEYVVRKVLRLDPRRADATELLHRILSDRHRKEDA